MKHMIRYEHVRYKSQKSDGYLICDNLTLPTNQRFAILCMKRQEMSALVELTSGQETVQHGYIDFPESISFKLAANDFLQINWSSQKNLHLLSRLYGVRFNDLKDFLLDVMGGSLDLNVPIRTLPRNQFAMVLMAISYAIPFQVYIADRSALPNGSQHEIQRIQDYLQLLDQQGRGLLLFTQSPVEALRCCTHGAIFDNGELSAHDTIDRIVARYRKLTR